MCYFRRLILTTALTVCATSGAWAQAGTKALSTNSTLSPFTFGNDTFTVSGCSVNSQNSTGCSSLEIVATVFRGVVTLTLQNKTSGTSIINDSSTSGAATVSLTITIGHTSNKSYESITKVDTTTTGKITSGHSASGAFVFNNNNFRGNSNTNDLLDTLSTSNGSPTAGTTSGTQASSGWTVTETFSLNDANADSTNNILKGSISFHKAPEPASIALLTVGMGGLMVAQRRRRRGI